MYADILTCILHIYYSVEGFLRMLTLLIPKVNRVVIPFTWYDLKVYFKGIHIQCVLSSTSCYSDAWRGGFFIAKPALALHSHRWASSDKQSRETVPTAQVLPGSPKGMVTRGSDQLRPFIRSQCTIFFFLRISHVLFQILEKVKH